DRAGVNAGDAAGFTVTVSNEGRGTAFGGTLSAPLPGGLGSDVNWQIDPATGDASAFSISGPVGSQVLRFSAANVTLTAGASLIVHVAGVTSANDADPATFAGTLSTTATANATNETTAEQID